MKKEETRGQTVVERTIIKNHQKRREVRKVRQRISLETNRDMYPKAAHKEDYICKLRVEFLQESIFQTGAKKYHKENVRRGVFVG